MTPIVGHIIYSSLSVLVETMTPTVGQIIYSGMYLYICDNNDIHWWAYNFK
jgi:hypothetical protein